MRKKAAGKKSVKEAVSRLTRKAIAAVRNAAKKKRPAANAAKPQPAPKPIARRSVVNRPGRAPTVRAAKRPADAPRAAKRPAKTGAAVSAPLPAAPAAGAGPAPSAPPPFIPPSAAPAPEESFSIPSGYGDNRIVLMVKDPWWLHAYWEIQSSTERAVRAQLLPQEVAGLQTVLRVYDVTGAEYPRQPAYAWFDIPLSGLANNWYIHTNAPGRAFIVEIGLLVLGGRFLLLARSNRVHAPRFGPSDIIDEAWAVSDDLYWKLFGAWGALGGSSPGEWVAKLSERLSSSSRSSMSMLAQAAPPVVRGFWNRSADELTIHGATAPKSSVVIQGRPADVQADGTFSLRFPFPSGIRAVTIEVTSPDGRHIKSVTPMVNAAGSGLLSADDGATPPPLPAAPAASSLIKPSAVS